MSAQISRRLVKVQASDGEIKEAHLQVCSHCKGEEFFVFRLKGDDHDHQQCTNGSCNEVYCHSEEHHLPEGLMQ